MTYSLVTFETPTTVYHSNRTRRFHYRDVATMEPLLNRPQSLNHYYYYLLLCIGLGRNSQQLHGLHLTYMTVTEEKNVGKININWSPSTCRSVVRNLSSYVCLMVYIYIHMYSFRKAQLMITYGVNLFLLQQFFELLHATFCDAVRIAAV